eukprot:364132-Chlamydomonas_euryale.AAC.5
MVTKAAAAADDDDGDDDDGVPSTSPPPLAGTTPLTSSPACCWASCCRSRKLAVAGDKAGLLPPRTRSSAAHTATAAGAPLVGALGAHGDDDAGGGESSGMSLGGRAASGAVPRGMQQV